MKYTIVNKNGVMQIHRTNCQDVGKAVKAGLSSWDNEADSIQELIHKEKQELYEDAGGDGDFELDTDLHNEPRSFAEQSFEILPCTNKKY